MNDVLPKSLYQARDKAQAALQRFGTACDAPPPGTPSDTPPTLPCCIRREVVFSAQVEGARFSLPEFLRYEAAEIGRVPDDVAASLAHAGALEYSLARLREGAPLDGCLVREVGARLAPPQAAKPCMDELEPLLDDATASALTRAALVHAQCATIRPFAHDNHRIARSLVVMMLYHDQPAHRPLLGLGLYFRRNRRRYHELLDDVESVAGREHWLAFFFTGVCEMAAETAIHAQKLAHLIERDRDHLGKAGVPPSVGTVHAAFCRRPISTTTALATTIGSSYPTAQRAVQRLFEQRMVDPLDAEQRNRRAFVYTKYLNLLNEDPAPSPSGRR